MAALDLWLLLLCIFGLLVALGATSGVVNEQLWVSEPLACVLAGVAVGPLGAGLLHLDPATNKLDAAIVREAARVTLAIAVTGAAMRLPAYWLTQNWRGLAIALGPGMLLMWAAGALVTSVTIGLPTLGCLLLGAAIAPTDPVLSAPILSGRGLAQRAVPPDLRNAMTAESAINDGLGLPLVILPILLMRQAPATAGLYWIVHVVGWEIGGAVAAGAAVGWANAKCMTWARGRPDADGASLLTVTISLALATMAGVHLLGADEILAAFVAGAVLNNVNRQAKVEEHHERFSETLGRFFDLPVMILFGAAIPWTAWSAIGTASGSGSGGSAGRGYSRHSSRCWHSAVRPRTWSSSSTARPRAPTSRRPAQKGAAAPGARPIARWVLDQNPPQDRQRLDKLRARIEQTIGKLKLFKRVAMRREKTDISLLSHYQLRMQSDAG